MTESLDINANIDFKSQTFVRELFVNQYLALKYLEFPNANMELSLI